MTRRLPPPVCVTAAVGVPRVIYRVHRPGGATHRTSPRRSRPRQRASRERRERCHHQSSQSIGPARSREFRGLCPPRHRIDPRSPGSRRGAGYSGRVDFPPECRCRGRPRHPARTRRCRDHHAECPSCPHTWRARPQVQRGASRTGSPVGRRGGRQPACCGDRGTCRSTGDCGGRVGAGRCIAAATCDDFVSARCDGSSRPARPRYGRVAGPSRRP